MQVHGSFFCERAASAFGMLVFLLCAVFAFEGLLFFVVVVGRRDLCADEE
jgi:hypothetical protein